MSAPGARAAARLAGEKFYLTGRPCVHGHISERYTNNSACLACSRKGRRTTDLLEGQSQYGVEASSISLNPLPDGQVSRVAAEGTASSVHGISWLTQQSNRLEISLDTVITAVKFGGWTLIEVEQLSRDDVEQLADLVSKHKRGEGFVRWQDYDPGIEVE